MDKILVPIDGSKGSNLALEQAKKLGEFNGSKITILHVISNVVNNPYILEQSHKLEVNEVFEKQGQKVLDNALSKFKDYPGEVNTEIRLGDPAQEVIDLSDKGEYDLVVMGNRGLNAFSRVMMGSVSNRVLNHVKTSVFIVKE